MEWMAQPVVRGVWALENILQSFAGAARRGSSFDFDTSKAVTPREMLAAHG